MVSLAFSNRLKHSSSSCLKLILYVATVNTSIKTITTSVGINCVNCFFITVSFTFTINYKPCERLFTTEKITKTKRSSTRLPPLCDYRLSLSLLCLFVFIIINVFPFTSYEEYYDLYESNNNHPNCPLICPSPTKTHVFSY